MNVSIASLWLPIVLSGVAVFVVSSLIWAVIEYHEADWKKLPDEEAARAALKGTPPGQYSLPHAADASARKDEAWLAKYREGPAAMLTVVPHGSLAMGNKLLQWFVYCVLISAVVAYVAGISVPAGTDYMTVFRVISTTALLAYGGAAGMNAIWFGYTRGRVAKDVLDAFIYALVTAGIFGWLWP